MHVLAKLPGGSLVQLVGLRYCVEPPGNGRDVGYRKRLLACEILSSFFEVLGGPFRKLSTLLFRDLPYRKAEFMFLCFRDHKKI